MWPACGLLFDLQDQKTAQSILERWKEAGADTDPSQLRKLFLKQSLVPITASVVQVCVDRTDESVIPVISVIHTGMVSGVLWYAVRLLCGLQQLFCYSSACPAGAHHGLSGAGGF
jgi:hypothetical protein